MSEAADGSRGPEKEVERKGTLIYIVTEKSPPLTIHVLELETLQVVQFLHLIGCGTCWSSYGRDRIRFHCGPGQGPDEKDYALHAAAASLTLTDDALR